MYKLKLTLKITCVLAGLLLLTKSGIAQESFSFTIGEAQNYAIENSYMSQVAKKDIEISESKI